MPFPPCHIDTCPTGAFPPNAGARTWSVAGPRVDAPLPSRRPAPSLSLPHPTARRSGTTAELVLPSGFLSGRRVADVLGGMSPALGTERDAGVDERESDSLSAVRPVALLEVT
ncbi:protein of unknown function [Rhodovastum atsumiense]|nr:protein of unknown function [Rhodovastum atsumiense]